MITQEQQKKGTELMNALVKKAWESAAFKEQLIEKPVSAIESVTGEKMKENTNVVVEDQTDDSIIYFNIPRERSINEFELTDEQLEQISGGIAALTAIACITLGVYIYQVTNNGDE